MNNLSKKWLNIHIPKCAGTTFVAILQRNFGSSFGDGRSFLSDRRFKYNENQITEIFDGYSNLKCFSDHKNCINCDLEKLDLKVIAFIRNPVERFLSHYYYCRERARQGVIFDHEAARLSLPDYIEEVLFRNPKIDLRNGQCYHLFGANNNDGNRDSFRDSLDGINMDRVLLLPVSRFDDACILLENLFPDDFGDCSYIPLNKSRSRSRAPDHGLRERIAEAMEFDIDLYELAANTFEQKLSNCFPDESLMIDLRRQFGERCEALVSQERRRSKWWRVRLNSLLNRVQRLVGG